MDELLLNTYEVLKELGAGGGGVVYLARHTRLDKFVVLKADRRKITTNPEVLRREVESLKNLNQQYIPKVYDFFIEEDTVYTVIDYIEGQSFDRALKAGETFTQAQVVTWAKQLLQALEYLHTRPPHGILHADIKPANIMLTPEGDIRLIDFNIALVLKGEGAVAVGHSFGYASPEHYLYSQESASKNRQKEEAPPKVKKTPRAAVPVKKPSPYVVDDSVPVEYRRPVVGRKPSLDADFGATQDNDVENVSPFESYGETVLEGGTSLGEDGATELNSPIGIDGETVLETDMGKTILGPRAESASSGSTDLPTPMTHSNEKMWLDVRSDVYSLGATLYHLLTGKRPAREAREVEKITTSGVNPSVIRIIEKAMNPDPDKRYQTAKEMRLALEALPKKDPRAKRLRFANAVSSFGCLALFLAGGVGTYVGLTRMEATQASKTLAEYSATALSQGNPTLAMQYALESLPEPDGFLIPEYTAEGQYALTQALGVYQFPEGYQVTRTLTQDSETLAVALSPDGSLGATSTFGKVTLFEVATGNTIVELPTVESTLAEAYFVGNDLFFYAGVEGVTLYDCTEFYPLWTGELGTRLTFSESGSYFASIYKDESRCLVYNWLGEQIKEVDLEGYHQWIPVNDRFYNPNNNLFAMNNDGTFLAVSMDGGRLMVFDITPSGLDAGGDFLFFEDTDYTTFSGGFYGDYFALSAIEPEHSLFVAFDTKDMSQTGAFALTSHIHTKVNESGIWVSNENVLVTMHPVSGEQTEVAYTGDGEITDFFLSDNGHVLVFTNDFSYSFFDPYGNLIEKRNEGDNGILYGSISNHSALFGGVDSSLVKVMELQDYPEEQFAIYNSYFQPNEVRISSDEQRIICYKTSALEIYNLEGTLLAENTIDTSQLYDQLFYRDPSGDYLEVIYYDGTRVHYSGETGEITHQTEGEPPDYDLEEWFETDHYQFQSEIHGYTKVFHKDSGEFYMDVEVSDYLTYVTQLDSLLLLEFLSTDSSRYGLLYNEALELVGRLPDLCDTKDSYFYFNGGKGKIRRTSIYQLEELLTIAKQASI